MEVITWYKVGIEPAPLTVFFPKETETQAVAAERKRTEPDLSSFDHVTALKVSYLIL